MNIIIDVREKNELKQKYLISQDKNSIIINLPSSQIQNYIIPIVNLSQNKGNIYLVCRSGERASIIKNNFFRHVNNIYSLGTIEDASNIFDIDVIYH